MNTEIFLNIAKSGVLAVDAFFDILQLNGISLNEADRNRIALKGKGRAPGGAGGQFVNYREALGMINIDPESLSNGQEEEIKWVLKGALKGVSNGQGAQEDNSKA